MSLRVGKALYGGNFATDDGSEHPFVLPGELLEKAANDGAAQIVEASQSRTAPTCIHFGVCGGCHYQHAAYSKQLRVKAAILQDLLRAAGPGELPVPEVNSAQAWGYRNRIRLRLSVSSGGGLEAGYSRRATNDFLPVQMCPIAAPLLWRAAEKLKQLSEGDAVCRRWLESASEVELFCTGDQRRLQIRLFLTVSDTARRDAASFATFCEVFRAEMPELSGAGASLDPVLGRKERRSWSDLSWGAEGLVYEAADHSYWVSRGAFFQVNRFLLSRLVELVTFARSGTLAWDLYAGVGLFSRVLAGSFSQVLAVEGGEVAARDLAGAARAQGAGRLTALRVPILEFLQTMVLQRDRPDLVVLDPPRAGLGTQGCELLSRIGPAEIVYVSCDPLTLARDLAVLTGRGYSVEKIDLVDMFPHTFHIETVVALHRV